MGTFSVSASAKSVDAVCMYLQEPLHANYRNILRNVHVTKNLYVALYRHITTYIPVLVWCIIYSTFSSQDFDVYTIYIHTDLMDGRPRPKKTWCVFM
ncbi:pI9R [African swine fever virus]|uniref:PI9R n=1 Tax=African swine fever virus TaxID=10497 RepID=A0A856Z113_ASF|nr:pI9R [African swine fever virus]